MILQVTTVNRLDSEAGWELGLHKFQALSSHRSQPCFAKNTWISWPLQKLHGGLFLKNSYINLACLCSVKGSGVTAITSGKPLGFHTIESNLW